MVVELGAQPAYQLASDATLLVGRQTSNHGMNAAFSPSLIAFMKPTTRSPSKARTTRWLPRSAKVTRSARPPRPPNEELAEQVLGQRRDIGAVCGHELMPDGPRAQPRRCYGRDGGSSPSRDPRSRTAGGASRLVNGLPPAGPPPAPRGAPAWPLSAAAAGALASAG